MKLRERFGTSATVVLATILALAVVWLVLRQQVAVPRGLSVAVHPTTSLDAAPVLETTTTEVSLDFLRRRMEWPQDPFRVRWEGYWFVPREQTVVLRASSSGRVTVIVDGRRVVRPDASRGRQSASGTVALDPGPHQIVVDYEHHGDSEVLNLEWHPRGELPRPLASVDFFTRRLDLDQFRRTRAIEWLGTLLIVALIAAPVLAKAPTVGRRMLQMTMRDVWSRLRILTFPALFTPLQLFVFGTHTIYRGNLAEFSASFSSLAASWIPAFAALAGGLLAVGLMLDQRWFQRYVVWLVGLGLVVWLQGGLLAGAYGGLDGQELDWGDQAWRVPYEVALWVTVPLVMVVFTQALFSIAPFASQVLVALQTVVLLGSGFSPGAAASPGYQSTPDWVFELSREHNVIHIVLDGFQSDVFHEIIEDNPRSIGDQLSGFTFFADHAGVFPKTITSIPAMLTGAVYRNQEEIQAWVSRQSRDHSVLAVLQHHGFETDAVSIRAEVAPGATNTYAIPRPFTDYRDYARFAGWQLLDLSLFRHAPHVLKPWIYNNQSWRLQSQFGQRENGVSVQRSHHAGNGHAFLEEFIRRVHVGRDQPVYKFLHVGVPHLPVVLGPDCEFIGVQRATRGAYADQARCALDVVTRLLDRLRSLGLYDDSVIILSSDHGISMAPRDLVGVPPIAFRDLRRIAGRARALLVLKPAHATGPLRISDAPTSITDLPATVADALGIVDDAIVGIPALRVVDYETRERSFAWYTWREADWREDFLAKIEIFGITGRMSDQSAWESRGVIFEPGVDTNTLSEGLYEPETDAGQGSFRWTHPHVVLYAPPHAASFAVSIRADASEPQTVTVMINGKQVGRLTLADQSWRTLEYVLPQIEDAASARIDLQIDPPQRFGPRRRGVMMRDVDWGRR